MNGRFLRDRPVRESRMPDNMRNQPHCDNGEGVDLVLSLTHLLSAFHDELALSNWCRVKF